MEENTRLGFEVAEQELGISPLLTVEEMSSVGEPDSLSMAMYLSQFYQLLKDTPPPAGETQEAIQMSKCPKNHYLNQKRLFQPKYIKYKNETVKQ